ncbi:uncharacterized protein B0H18DRAFT_577021 [Fomitopsis serialis]|uniref:uncharacterized protein n=1 Tax=Fomitopsis serialis TaxID=139415 RepID=UPI0020081656|nr:uncharacterized protein B0H18DRAFT_577021 [Neoantrodia serialis]KAH9920902.1 hypothetical protein B0H18DRAFT_577021 [Neoantrodia serialis]
MPQQGDVNRATPVVRDGGYAPEKGFKTERPMTQDREDQCQLNEKQRKAAEHDLVQSWMAGLQLISVITTFFATMEATLLGSVTPTRDQPTTHLQIAACTVLAGAFTVHLSAAILAFLASFFLIGYRVKEATEEEWQAEARPSLESGRSSNMLRGGHWTTSPHLEQCGPFRSASGPPTHLLKHCHTLCMWFSITGFLLAIAGGLCYSWARLPQSASIVASVSLGACWTAGAGAVALVL